MDLERRQSERKATNIPAEIRNVNGSVIASCVVCNMSDGGAKLLFESDVEVPKEFLLMLNGLRTLGRRCQLIWRLGNKVGVLFPTPAGTGANSHNGSGVFAAK
jgi:hypothetical protein